MPPLDSFEKKIWFYWHQGLHAAPDLVQKCHRSWQARNPTWEVLALSSNDLDRYLDHDDWNISSARPQALSDLIRINLLRKHGGLWVDASCFCIKPLDDWIPAYLSCGFFAFANPGPDRLLSSWFLASDRDNYITSRWADASNSYWSGAKAPIRLVRQRLANWATALQPNVWFSKPVKEWLRLYPYYWFHYLFRYLYERDERFRAAWDQVPKLTADVPHAAQRKGLDSPIDASFKREIDQRVAPLYKLNWRAGENALEKDSILRYLYQTL